MTRAGFGLRSVFVAGAVLALGSLTGCGSDAGASTSQAVSTSQGVINRSPTTAASSSQPTIAGVPVATAVAGQPYSFQPQVANTSGTIQFSIAHLPAWAKFNTSTGQLSGTPDTSNVGKYPGIAINLVNGANVVALPAFTITVAAATSKSNTVTLSWQAPTENSDGSTLSDLTGYKVHYGSASKSYSDTIQVANAGLTTYVVQNLAAGTYYFAVTAYNATGKESSLSGEVSTQVD
jgi:Putative Ig domain